MAPALTHSQDLRLNYNPEEAAEAISMVPGKIAG
jgi:hypothetical protein